MTPRPFTGAVRTDVEVAVVARDGRCARAIVAAVAALSAVLSVALSAALGTVLSAGPVMPVLPSVPASAAVPSVPSAAVPAAAVPSYESPRATPSGPGHGSGRDRVGGHRSSYALTVRLASASPAVLRRPDGWFTLSGTVVNHSRYRVTGAHVGVRTGPAALGTRSGLAAAAVRTDLTRADGEEISGHVHRLPSLAPGARRDFRLRIPVPELGAYGAGAYGLTVDVARGDGAVLGLARTFLPVYPEGTAYQPLRTTVLWPITDTPHMEALTLRTQESVRPVFRDDALAAAFAEGGRLRRLVETGARLPVTWAVDPDLVAQARAMADGYRVARTPGATDPRQTTEGRGGRAAAAWLAALKRAVRGQDVIALPYADPDLASLARGGPGGDALAGLLRRASRAGKDVVDRELDTDARADVAWPAGGAVDAGIAGYAERLGLGTVLASGSTVGGLRRSSGALVTGGATDDRAVALGERMTALTYDTTVASLLAQSRPGAGAAGAPLRLRVRQRLLAESLTAVRELPYAPRALMVVPPRRMSAGAARAVSESVSEGLGAGWLEPSRLEAAAQDPEPGQLREAEGYPVALRASELPARSLAAVARDQRRLGALSKVLSDPGRTTASAYAAMARAVSTSWRGNPAGARSYRRGVSRFLTASIDSVRLVPKSKVTVAGQSATIPVTVDNGLQQDLTGVELRVASSRPERLAAVDRAVGVQASRAVSRTVRVGVRAHANGPVRLTAQLYTSSDGRPWGRPITFTADVRSVPSGAVAFVAGGVGLMMLAAAFRLRRAQARGGAPPPGVRG
ncbi:DUF6049 family protein [Streptomyces sp. NBS 14/10]|uniref:DUF6049 family protein n=1 Tax=Streptomyces sp. NBS 14/10 TaxID=1945643 RepID=UPI000D1ADFAE|nr:DUF6049 family protein [Streptomyces sp. NBS 14/10]